MSSKFFTNSQEKCLFNKFTGIIKEMQNLYAFHAVVGYFRSSGYFALQPFLEKVSSIKILVGINVDQMFAEAQRKGMLFFGDEEKTKDEFLRWFIQDIKEAKYSAEVEKGILQFVQDLVDGRIEVRAHKTKILHAKFYLLLPEYHNNNSDGWVIMGSSNLTEAGLGIKKSPNYEMNVSLKDFDDVNFANNEFKTLWQDSTPILPADIEQFRQKTHIGQTYTPFELYIKFLIEYFGNNIDYDPDTVGDLPKSFKKLSYQIDAVNQGFHMLLQHNGFFLADVVGLGKTVVAAMITKRFLIANGSLNTKVLVVYPPAIEKNWKTTFRLFGIDRHTKFITNGRLEKILDGDLNYWPKEEYDLILVDEAHRYRNHTSQMFSSLQRICKAPRKGEGLIEGFKKKVILISATPLNNRPQDLYYQLLLFQDARRSTLPETNLQNFFGPIIQEYREIIRDENPNIKRIRELYKDIRERVIQPITIRRTRKDLDKFPEYKNDLIEQGIKFPEIAPPKARTYFMDTALSKLFYQTIFYLTDEDKINYFRYQAIRYLKEEVQEQFYEKAPLISKSLAAIMKTLMVKRLESSFNAFRISLNNLLLATFRMIEMFENGKVYIAPDLNINNLMNKGMTTAEIEELIMELSAESPRNNIFSPDDFEPEFLEGLKKDVKSLLELKKEWVKVEQDPKLDEFIEFLNKEAFREELNPSGKLIVFTESTDTADYLERNLLQYGFSKVLSISSRNRNKAFEIVQQNFDANYVGTQKDDFSILLTTDILAEGINLHRANMIINYDTPWNATRLMQRIGRVNRIGSLAGVIYNYSFYPSQQGDEEIHLYNNALVKLQAFHSAFGEDAQIYTHEELVEQFELFEQGMPDDEDKRLFYLRFIREFKEQFPNEFKRLKNLPLKARTGRSANKSGKKKLIQNSVVFLKSHYKMEFYLVNPKKQVKSLTFLETAKILEANSTEPSFEIPDFHYDQVQTALAEFEKDFLISGLDTVASIEKADAITKKASKFARDIKALSNKQTIKSICENLEKLINNGTFAQLSKEVKTLSQKFDKRSINLAQTENILLVIAKKYDAIEKDDEDKILNGEELSTNIDPEIVISETFID